MKEKITYFDAVKAALAAFREIFAEQNASDPFLEEFENSEDGRHFLVTLGFNRMVKLSETEESIGASPVRREFKTFHVNRKTGNVDAIKMKGSKPLTD